MINLMMYACQKHSTLFLFISLLTFCSLSDSYDPLDPNGNITVTFDIHTWVPNGYVARITVQNYYLYRHIIKPGWNLGWSWTKNEVIWTIRGAFVTIQGDCSKFKYNYQIPHSCNSNPVFADLTPEQALLGNNWTDNCCHEGVLSSWAVDPDKSFSSFEVTVGNLEVNTSGYLPVNLTFFAPGSGYTCGPVVETHPTVSSDMNGQRKIQVFRTWKSTCTYASFLANKTPLCCVSLSAFYNPQVTTCPKCSCGCREEEAPDVPCIRPSDSSSDVDILQCTDHMCPVRVHWHIKNNYMDHWRVKLTISNFNYKRNYSDWNVVVQHPGFSQKSTAYSFNSTSLPSAGIDDAVALFWGLPYYNDELLQANSLQIGSVTTEILIEKDIDAFTLSNGWALPRKIYFSGEECEMPQPDNFPMLPNASNSRYRPDHQGFLIAAFAYLILYSIGV